LHAFKANVDTPSEIFGEIVQDLRERRLAGASISQLVEHFHSQGMSLFAINQHFREAFGISHTANLNMLPKDEHGLPQAEMLDEMIAAQVDANLEQWKSAPPYPDLWRRRDRDAFRQVAKRTGNVIVVCAVDQTKTPGIDSGYQIHGVYKNGSGVNAWTPADGEKMRAELNNRMGRELIRNGPLDISADRLGLADDDPRKAPRPPVLFFLPDGGVQVRSDSKGMELYYRFLKIDWDQLYPPAAKPQES
jgi:hypothetical protein